RRVRLDGDARLVDAPRTAEGLVDGRRVVAAARRAEVPALRLEGVARRAETAARELSREDRTLGGTSRVEGLGHRAEVLAHAAGLRRREAERDPGALEVESEHPRGARGRADRPERRGRVEARVVVTRIDRFRDL